MEPQYKTAKLKSWNEDRGFGILEVPGSTFPLERYFLHISEIKEGPCPPPRNCVVRFEAGPPHKPGQLPCALRALIVALPEKPTEKVSEPAPKDSL
jgi:cold shock CspA family protein